MTNDQTIMKHFPAHIILGLSLLGCSLGLTGCSTTGLFRKNFWDAPQEIATADNPVTQVIPTWQEGEGPGLKEGTLARGFKGQIYFISREKGLPSVVNGKVRVYLFDDQGSHDERVKPIHQFDFEAEAWKHHEVATKLGPAYAVFIPYTGKGSHRVDCSLRVKYIPEDDGPAVFSQMVPMTLSGGHAVKVDSVSDVTAPQASKTATHTEVTPIAQWDLSRSAGPKVIPQLRSEIAGTAGMPSLSARPMGLSASADGPLPLGQTVSPAEYSAPVTDATEDANDAVVSAVYEKSTTTPRARRTSESHPLTGVTAENPPMSSLKTFTIPLNGE